MSQALKTEIRGQEPPVELIQRYEFKNISRHSYLCSLPNAKVIHTIHGCGVCK